MIRTGKDARCVKTEESLASVYSQSVLTLLGKGEEIRPAEGKTTHRLQSNVKMQDTYKSIESSCPACDPNKAEDAPQHGDSHKCHYQGNDIAERTKAGQVRIEALSHNSVNVTHYFQYFKGPDIFGSHEHL